MPERQHGLTKSDSRTLLLLGRFPSFSDLMSAYSADKILRFAQYPDKCYFGTAPTIGKVNAAYGNSASVQWLMAVLSFVGETQLGRKMSPGQQEFCARLIVNNYPYLRLTELMLFFSRFLSGTYGRYFVDTPSIMTALRDGFMRDRAGAYDKREADLRREQSEADSERYRNMTEEERESIQETIKKVLEKFIR